MSTATQSSLDIRRVNPLLHGAPLKRLFAAHERTDFADYFDRAYPNAVMEGASSWIGVDENGSLSMHIARFPQRFDVGDKTACGGLLVNLMTARAHRSFFPTLKLLRRVISDSRADGDIDFLYADPNEQARSLIKASGFVPIGELERFVLPLRGSRWHTDLVVHAYHVLLRALRWRRGLRVTHRPSQTMEVASLERPGGFSSGIRPYRPASLYGRRLAEYPSNDYHWYVVESAHPPNTAAVLVRDAPDGSALLCSVRRAPEMPLSRIMPALTTALRRAGYRSAWLWTLAKSRFATELEHAGFRRRQEHLPVFGLALTPLGERVLHSTATWETTHLDWDR